MLLLHASLLAFAATNGTVTKFVEDLRVVAHAPPHKAPMAHHAAPHIAPRKSPHVSAPRHHPPAKVAHTAKPVHHTAKPIVHHTVTPPTRAFRASNTTVVRNTTINPVIIRSPVAHSSSRMYYRHGSRQSSYFNHRAYYHTRTSGMRSLRMSHYSRRNVNQQSATTVVKGVVDSTVAPAATGTVSVKVLPASTSRFQYGMAAITVPKNAAIRAYKVNTQTQYTTATDAKGGFKATGFKDLVVGEPVLIVTPRAGNTLLAQSIERFPAKK